MDSTSLFLLERGVAVVAALIVVTGLVGRTLKRELPTGFFPATGSLTYGEKIEEAASSSDTVAAVLIARLDEHDISITSQGEDAEKLAKTLDGVIADIRGLEKTLKSARDMS